jgi:hypothetical protein
VSASRHASCVIRTKGWHTDVIQEHDLIVANLGVLRIGGDNKLMASGYRDLQQESKTVSQTGRNTRKGERGRKKQRTSMPSLIRPVLISGPFCHAVISINPRQDHEGEGVRMPSETGQTVSRAIATGRPPGSAVRKIVSFKSARRETECFFQRKKTVRTSNHFTSVIYDTLVVLIRSMGEVHANCIVKMNQKPTNGGGEKIDISIERTDIDTGPSKLSQLLGVLTFGPKIPHCTKKNDARGQP